MNILPSTDLLDAALKFDGLAIAEKLTGESYKTDKETEMLGFGLFTQNNRLKDRLLDDAGDTTFQCTLNKQLEIALAEGFKVVLMDKFVSDWTGDDGVPYNETYMVLWNPEGFLMTLESFRETSRNNAKLYYNLDLNEIKGRNEPYHNYTSSGGFISDCSTVTPENRYGESTGLWAGDHDAREAFRYTLNKLRQAKPLPVWKHAPFLWLLTYAEPKVQGYDYKAITDSRIARLPQEVQDAIKGDPRYF